MASTPSSRGIRTSISTTSARVTASCCTASSAVARLADDLEVVLAVDEHPEAGAHHLLVVDQEHPDRLARRAHAAHRGILADTRNPPPRPGSGLERAVVHADPLAHADQAQAAAVVGAARAAAVVLDEHRELVADRDRHRRRRAGAGVLADVAERLLHDAVRRERRRRRGPAPSGGGRRRVHVGAGGAGLLDQHGDVGRAAAAGGCR